MQMMKLAQRVENRELRQIDAGLGTKASPQLPLFDRKEPHLLAVLKDGGKMMENPPMRTITLRGVSTIGNRREGLARRLTNVEFQAKRDKGLCFRCDEQYSAGHRCKNRDQRELRVLVVMGGVDDLEVVVDDGNQEEQTELQMLNADDYQLIPWWD